ncbi:hypothetical protein BUALT_Bualt03G0152300 [Buddleja alternifolia]|uniref:Uncharacterized protein n=1 Tax=Buddleja alternifolia TaxID=168488 RepID=A0AAV6XW71_9LAMI|nr:hypothetical protein BUALT_Bualt03G0152300 [Buddleja alternifolia]
MASTFINHEIAGLVTEVGSKVRKEKVGDGGYSDIIVCGEHFIICWPEHMPLDAGCPLLCAGITTYSPMKYFGLDKPGIHLGVVGLGGLRLQRTPWMGYWTGNYHLA